MSAETPEQQLETSEDFLLLQPGDIVETGTLASGLGGPMVVSRDSREDTKVLIQRLNFAEIFKIALQQGNVSVENGQLKFDPTKGGKRINVMGTYDWSHYEAYRGELIAAGLEQ